MLIPLLLLMLAAPPPVAQTIVIASTAAARCDGRPQVAYWVAPRPVTIWRVELYPLSDGAAPGQPFPMVDYHTTVRVSRPPGRILAVQALDHYVPFWGDAHSDKSFTATDAARLRKGDHVAVEHSCQELFGLTSHSQFIAVLTYSED